MRWSVLVLVVAAGCGGPAKEPETSNTPPKVPPSMGGGDQGAQTPAPAKDMPPAPTGPMSEEVARGIKAFDAGDFPSAKAAFEAALKKNPKDADAAFNLGRTLEELKDKAGAEKAYRDALKAKPDHQPAAENLSGLLLDAERWDDAAQIAKAALAKHGDDAKLHLSLGVALAGKNDQAGATKELDESVRIAPNDASTLLTYAHWLGVWKQLDAAAAKLRAARPLAGSDVAMLAGIGHEMRAVGAFGDCVPTYDKAIGIQDVAELRVERALCKLGAKDKDGALADLQAAVQRDASFAVAHYHLGGVLADSGKFKEAVAELETYVKMAPSGPMAQKAQAKIAKIKERMKK
jgi:tetratricopeptide (TPR) repeat protein